MTTVATRSAVVCALALALAGCASSPSAQATTAPAQTSASTTAAPAAEPTTPPTTAPTSAAVEERAQQKAALDAYVEAERATMPEIEKAAPGVYTDISIQAVYPSTIDYHYVYAQQVDPAAANDYFESVLGTLQTACDTKVFPAMLSMGVTGSPKAIYTFDNADGSQLWTHTFEAS